jgi:hypothetical protein
MQKKVIYMEEKIIRLDTASKLSSSWDALADSCFQKREFLLHAEKYNPCNIRYYELHEEGKLAAGAMVYDLEFNVFTYFKNLKSPVRFTVIGPPASVSCSGLIGGDEALRRLVKDIFSREKGLVLGLNVGPSQRFEDTVSMQTLPTVAMSFRFESWEDYLSALRSQYRRRLRKIEESFKEIEMTESGCSRLDEAMYGLYLNIMNKTATKLEILSLEFFKNLPERYRLTTYSYRGQVITWHINVRDDDVCIFFFGGIDYRFNERFNAYFNNLIGITREAIGWGYKKIEFGQTAEIPKMRLGGRLVHKGMFLHHRNPLVRGIFHLARKLLSYDRKFEYPCVFKNEQDGGTYYNGDTYENIIGSPSAV